MSGLWNAFVELFDTRTIATIVAVSSPLLFASMGETISEKAGVINLSVDGSMMLSALAGFVVAFEFENVWLGFPAAAAVGVAVALIVAYGSIRLSLNQVAVGFVLFALCTELSRFLGSSYVGRQPEGVPAWDIPWLESIPFFGQVLFQQNLMVYLAILTVVATYFFMYRTRKGLELQGIGERPEAAHSRGIPVNRLRYFYTAVGGALIGIGGAAFTLDVKLGWSDRPTRNFGWIVLAIVIFGGWHPLRVAVGVLLFRTLEAYALNLIPEFPSLSQVLPSIPFPLMILALVIVNWKAVLAWLDRYPFLRAILRSDPPTAIGTRFEIN
ncbi:MAG: ABC transporter permease [Acidimicrobiia bacterium]|nr:ABC transporter permease [Acidimicrobiia bacterium]